MARHTRLPASSLGSSMRAAARPSRPRLAPPLPRQRSPRAPSAACCRSALKMAPLCSAANNAQTALGMAASETCSTGAAPRGPGAQLVAPAGFVARALGCVCLAAGHKVAPAKGGL